MKKRFTDTEKWSDKWFRPLSETSKLLWIWLCDNCDNAGVIDPDMELLSFQIGKPVKEDHFRELGDRIQPLANGKWWIPKFVRFQFGQLSTNSLVHRSVIALVLSHKQLPKDSQLVLEVNALSMGCQRDMGFLSDMGFQSPKEKEKEKEEEKEIRGSMRGRTRAVFQKPSLEEVKQCFYSKHKTVPPSEAEKFFNYYESKGWVVGKTPMKSWPHAVANWIKHWEEMRFTPDGAPRQSGAEVVVSQKSLERIEARIEQIRRNKPVNGWKKEDAGYRELEVLKLKRQQLMDKLGMIV